MKGFALKKDMLLGACASATQCEGGELESSWIYWWGLGNIRDGASPAQGAQHWKYWREDVEILRAMGATAHRMGIDWTRVEPREEEFDDEALARYREELRALREAGIRVQLELHHFNDPVWFAERGGFERVENFGCYLHYVEHVAAYLGDLVDEYLTFAEPNAYALGGYLGGGFPPGKNNISACFRVLTRMAECHAQAYGLLHSLHGAMGYAPCWVGVSLRLSDYVPAEGGGRVARALTEGAKQAFDAAFEGFCLGRVRLPMKHSTLLRGEKSVDLLAIDWQGFAPVSTLRSTTPANEAADLSAPERLHELLAGLHARCAAPISLTLHGVEGEIRVPYLFEHLRAACESELPIERVFYGAFTDGFEWLDGQSARRGLVAVDPDTQERSATDAFALMQGILKHGGATEALYDEYFED